MEIYKDYLSKSLSNVIAARQALEAYKKIKQKDLKNVASYHAQQAIELLLKYSIYNDEGYNQNNSEVKELRTHDLNRLITLHCIPLGIEVPQKIEKNAIMYSGWEAESRYSLHYSVRVDSIENALDEAEQWLIQIKPSYNKKIQQVRDKLGI